MGELLYKYVTRFGSLHSNEGIPVIELGHDISECSAVLGIEIVNVFGIISECGQCLFREHATHSLTGAGIAPHRKELKLHVIRAKSISLGFRL